MAPISLRIVAILNLIGGLASAIDIVAELIRGSLHLALGILGIPIYFGLLRYSAGWRTCALVFLWLAIILGPVFFLIALESGARPSVLVLGVQVAEVSWTWFSLAMGFAYAIVLWEYRVLTRPDIRALFLSEDVVRAAQHWERE